MTFFYRIAEKKNIYVSGYDTIVEVKLFLNMKMVFFKILLFYHEPIKLAGLPTPLLKKGDGVRTMLSELFFAK